jgi:hypothetical protein
MDIQMLMIAIEMASHKVMDTLFDGGSGMNIITNSLWIWLGLQGMQKSPFQVKMVDQWNVQPMGILKDLPI